MRWLMALLLVAMPLASARADDAKLYEVEDGNKVDAKTLMGWKTWRALACERCHGDAGWDRDLFFEHDLTAFPLLGLHAVVACEQCHASPAFRDADSRCIACQ